MNRILSGEREIGVHKRRLEKGKYVNSLVNRYCAAPGCIRSVVPNEGRIADILEKLIMDIAILQ